MSSKLKRFLRLVLLPAACAIWLSTLSTAQTSADSRLETDLLDILRDKGLISADQYQSLLSEAHRRADARANETTLIEASLQRLAAPDVQARGGQPGKLVFRTPDGKWSLGLKGYLQARVERTDSDDDTRDDTNFSVPRARLTLEGTAGAPNVKYRMELDTSTTSKVADPATETPATARDVYVDVGFLGDNSVRLGQFKFPMGREQLTSTSALDIQDLSITTQEFTPGYEPAAMVSGSLADGVFEYQAALSNGEGRGKNNTPGETKDGLREGARLVWNPLGAVKLEGPAFQTVDDGSTKFGLAASWMQNQDSTALNTVTPDATATTEGLEFGLYSGPLALMAETFHRVNEAAVGTHVIDRGWNYQLGWLLGSAAWEVVARYSSIDFGAKDDQAEKTVGLNYYVDRHNGKWMLDWSKLTGAGTVPDANRLRLQYQVMF